MTATPIIANTKAILDGIIPPGYTVYLDSAQEDVEVPSIIISAVESLNASMPDGYTDVELSLDLVTTEETEAQHTQVADAVADYYFQQDVHNLYNAPTDGSTDTRPRKDIHVFNVTAPDRVYAHLPEGQHTSITVSLVCMARQG